MNLDQTNRHRLSPLGRAVIEVPLFMFLFYSVRLMGEFTVTNATGEV
jgi:hypothetical protein